jgi:predicted phage-related endonuclease
LLILTKIVNEQIRKALLQRGLISNKMDEIHAVIWKDVQTMKADVKKVRKDLDQHSRDIYEVWKGENERKHSAVTSSLSFLSKCNHPCPAYA